MKPIYLFLFCFLLATWAKAQDYKLTNRGYVGNITTPEPIVASAPPVLTLPLPASNLFTSNKVMGALAVINLSIQDPKGDYPLGIDDNFTVQISYTLRAHNTTSSITLCDNCPATLENTNKQGKPEYISVKNYAPQLLNANNTPLYTELRLIISSITITNATPAVQSAIGQFLKASLGFTLESGIKAQGLSVDNLSQILADPNQSKKVYKLSWNSNIDFPNYEIQLLRLYNTAQVQEQINGTSVSPTNLYNGVILKGNYDWSKALRIETQSSDKFLYLTIAENTGWYVWRVRPVGTEFDGGITNPKNIGLWFPVVFREQGTIELKRGASGSPSYLKVDNSSDNLSTAISSVFYFEDPDEQRNNIYSRVFTEGNRVSEKITYANGLQQVKQMQTYLASKKTQLTTQTVYDYQGRPVVSTVPVPTDAPGLLGLGGYKERFALNEDNLLYSPRSFDEDANLKQPGKIKQASTAFDYYSGQQENVPDAEGYGFTRTTYYNDGTGRVKEQSGVGATHAMKSDGSGKTVKTYYGTAAKGELEKLFGSEAPDPQSVLKTITVDQNGVSSITYTSKEGKTIATSLSLAFTDSQSLDELDTPLNTDNSIEKVEDEIRKDATIDGVSTGAKRLAFNKETTIENISYTLDCNTVSRTIGCDRVTPTCLYELVLTVVRLDGPFNSLPAGWAFTDGARKAITQIFPNLQCSGTGSTVPLGSLVLPAGSYIFQKNVRSTGSGQITTSGSASSQKLMPLVRWIQDQLKTISCTKNLEELLENIKGLDNRLQQAGGIADETARKQAFEAVDRDYNLPIGFFDEEHAIKVYGIDSISVSAKCCKNLKVPIYLEKLIDCDDIRVVDRGGSPAGQYYVNPLPFEYKNLTEFYPDFEGYAYSYFWECVPLSGDNLNDISSDPEDPIRKQHANIDALVFPQYTLPATAFNFQNDRADAINPMTKQQKELQYQRRVKYIYYNLLKEYMLGWQIPGTFNTMVYHMLNDQYTTDGHDGGGQVVKNKPKPFTTECNTTKYPAFTTSLQAGTGKAIRTYIDNEAQIPVVGNGDNRQVTAQYYCEDLAKCWISQLAFIKDKAGIDGAIACPSGPRDLEVALQKQDENVSTRADDEQANHDPIFNAIGNGLFGKIVKFLKRKKIKNLAKQIRNMQNVNLGTFQGSGSEIPEPQELAPMDIKNYHMVYEFLNCTGYRFAKILTDFNPEPLEMDKDASVTYSVDPADYEYKNPPAEEEPTTPISRLKKWRYRLFRFLNRKAQGENDENSYEQYLKDLDKEKTYEGNPNRKYKRFENWKVIALRTDNLSEEEKQKQKEEGNETDHDLKVDGALVNREYFKNIKDPVFAFKYFEYVEYSQILHEMAVCFNDLNWRRVKENNAVKAVYMYNDYTNGIPTEAEKYDIDPIHGKPIADPNNVNLCDFCTIGYLKCDVNHYDWTSGQRYTFYALLQGNPFVVEDENDLRLEQQEYLPKADDFTAVGFIDQTEEQTEPPTTVFKGWEKGQENTDKEYTVASYGTLVQNNFVEQGQTRRLKTEVERQIDIYNGQIGPSCEQKREVFRQTLLQELQAKCYIIDGCRPELPANASAQDIINFEKVITTPEIELLVDALVEECKNQGYITTFRKISKGCRNIFSRAKININNVETWNLDYRDVDGSIIPPTMAWVEYGVGTGLETPGTGPEAPKIAKLHYRPVEGNGYGELVENPNVTLQTTYGGQTYPLIELPDVTDANQNDEALKVTDCQWVRHSQVIGSLPVINLKGYCDNQVTPLECQGEGCPEAKSRSDLSRNNFTSKNPGDLKPEKKSATLLNIEVEYDANGNPQRKPQQP